MFSTETKKKKNHDSIGKIGKICYLHLIYFVDLNIFFRKDYMLFEQEGTNLYCEMFVVIDLASKSLVVRFMRFLNSNRHLSLRNFSNNFTNEHRRHIFFCRKLFVSYVS